MKANMPLKGLSIAMRLAVVLGAILVLSMLSSLVAVLALTRLGADLDAMVSQDIKVERAASDWLRNTTGGVQRSSAIAKSSDASLVDYFAPASAASVLSTDGLQRFIEAHLDRPEQRALLEKSGDLRKQYLALRDAIGMLKKAGDAVAAQRVFADRFEPTAKAYLASVQAIVQAKRAQMDDNAELAAARRRWAIATLLTISAAALVAAALLAWWVARSITLPLRRAQDLARSIAVLDLRQPALTQCADDETGQLLKALDAMRAALTHALLDVRSVVEGISTASQQIASGNLDLSTRTEQAASSLQQTASSMEQMTGTVRLSSDAAAQAKRLALTAAELARRGSAVMAGVVQTMADINTSGTRIGDIIGVIDGIAFQTNILALNAAVEAARAGEHGRGFAVVASEVRGLAQRSAEAAREIKALIGVSLEAVQAGSGLVQAAGTTMTEIVAAVTRVTEVVAGITTAAAEQSTGIAQINQAVSHLDEMTQRNAALVEESAAAAQSLNAQALRLRGTVGSFRLGDRVEA